MTPIALTIAGSDSGGGAGIQADLKTFAALGVYAATAITALTAQNTRGVRAIHLAPPEIVLAQMDAVLSDFEVAAIKIGMLGSAEVVEAVAGRLRSGGLDGPAPPQGAGRGEERAPSLLPVLTGRGRGWGPPCG
jgi:hydroxymethylpyrimidine/phosphomethylpyrimidine kinase